MKILYTLAAMLVALCVASMAAAAAVPALTGPVNDYANVLTPEQASSLSSALLAQEKQTSNQIVVLTVKSLEGDTVENYAHTVFNSWHLGKKKEINKPGDNGILLVVATEDRKIRIEVGYGLEGELNDGLAGEIIRNDITPPLKEGKYYDGLSAGVAKIGTAINGTYVASAAPVAAASPFTGRGIGTSVMLFFLLIICMVIDKEYCAAAGTVGGIGSFLITLIVFSFWGALLCGIIGFIVGLIASTIGPDGFGNIISSIADSDSSGGGGGGYSGGGGSSGGGGASGSY